MPDRLRVALLTFVTLALAGCSGSALVAPKTAAVPAAASLGGRADKQNLYVANREKRDVAVYGPGDSNPIRTLSVQDPPIMMAFDVHDHLFVVYYRDLEHRTIKGVAEFLPGHTEPTRRIVDGIGNQPLSLGFDSSDNVYVGSKSSFSDDVTVYAPGSTSVLRTITNGVYNPDGLAFDRDGNLYVANHSSQPFNEDDVTVYKPGETKYARRITKGVYRPTAVVFDGSGNLYVANRRDCPFCADTVTVYSSGSGDIARTITLGRNYNPSALALDSRGNLYVACPGVNAVKVYKAQSTDELRSITNGISTPSAMTFSASGELYVANFNGNSVTVYGRESDKLLRTIREGIEKPTGVAFGP